MVEKLRMSQIPTKASALGGSERIEVTQSGTTKYTDPAQLRDYIAAELGYGLQYAQAALTGTTTTSTATLSFSSEVYDPSGIISITSGKLKPVPGSYLYLFDIEVQSTSNATDALVEVYDTDTAGRWPAARGFLLFRSRSNASSQTNQSLLSIACFATAVSATDLEVRVNANGVSTQFGNIGSLVPVMTLIKVA